MPPYIDQRHIGMTLNLPVNKTCRRAAFSARLAAFIKDLSKEIATSAHIKLILEPLRVRDEDSMLLIIGEAQKETFEGRPTPIHNKRTSGGRYQLINKAE